MIERKLVSRHHLVVGIALEFVAGVDEVADMEAFLAAYTSEMIDKLLHSPPIP